MTDEQGDIIAIDFDPQTGHKQKGQHPAFAVSNNNTCNRFPKAAMVCPITNTNKNIPVQIKLDNRMKTTGVIVYEQIKALDLSKRKATFLERAPADIIDDVVDMVYSFIEI